MFGVRYRFVLMPQTKMAGGKPGRRMKATTRARHQTLVVCGAAKRNGDPCGREAGWGTDHPGTGRCKHHGGSTPNGRKRAGKEEMLGLAQPLDVTPGQAVEGALRSAAGEMAYATMKVAGLSEDKVFEDTVVGPRLNPWVQLKHKAEERLLRAAKVGHDIGIDKAKLAIAQAQTAMMGSFMEAVLERLDLTPAQRKKVGPAIRKELAVIAGQGQETT